MNKIKLMFDTIAPLFGISALLVFNIKVYYYYKLENPDSNYIWSYITGKIIPFLFLSIFPLSSKKSKDNIFVKKINILTYLFYVLVFISFCMGFIGVI